MPDRATFLWLVGMMLFSGFHQTVVAQWWLDAGMGSSGDRITSRAGDDPNVVLGIRRSGAVWAEAVAGVPLDGSNPRWGSLSAGAAWMRERPAAWGISYAGEVYTYDRPAESAERGVLAELTGHFRVRSGRFSADLYGGPVFASIPTRGAGERWLVAGGAGGTFQTQELSVRIEGIHYQARRGAHPFLGASVGYGAGPFSVIATAGRWLGQEAGAQEWSAASYWRAARRVELHASVRQAGEDPVYGTSAHVTWSAGLSFALHAKPPADRPLPPYEVRERQVTFRVPGSESVGPPSVAGDFNGWLPIEMSWRDGSWAVTVPISAGNYRYSFRSSDGTWFLPSSVVHRVNDAFGGENGVLLVP